MPTKSLRERADNTYSLGDLDVSVLIGQTLASVNLVSEPGYTNSPSFIEFVTDTASYVMFHDQECCEDVVLEDACGDWADLIGSPILHAYQSSNKTATPTEPERDETTTWTFYTLATIRGTVTLRWRGESNGYYSETVNFRLLPEEDASEPEPSAPVRSSPVSLVGQMGNLRTLNIRFLDGDKHLEFEFLDAGIGLVVLPPGGLINLAITNEQGEGS